MAILHGFGCAFDDALADLPQTQQQTWVRIVNLDVLNMYKAMQANSNVMTWLMMTFPLLKHLHEINVSWTAGC